MKDVKKADALSGARGNSFMQQAAARGMQAAGENGGSGMAFMGMGMNAAGNMMGAMQQPNTGSTYQPNFGQNGQVPQSNNVPESDSTTRLLEAKKLLDAGVITQEDYDKLKSQILGI